ncbi:Uncharacterised protein [Mycoplasmopsis californica]|uniref:Lipoprotein n=1 Tax=Mycoplasmopsis equigenitalium TaxID=114883 RepID=A0ABY5J117_9BACT|nr:hypothetical protein [Mycoplasmopsis equigenitalium]UUD36944.1 hypothetical protein NPA09_03530 [Mycoplasmopsis equigenitalium]VEU69761.1 Uncharacterised protein [Mycoplasmopsis californica]
MKNKIKKFLISFSPLPILLPCVAVSCDKGTKSSQNNSTDLDNIDSTNSGTNSNDYTHKNVFPDFRNDEFQKFVRYNSLTKQAYLDKEIIAAFINSLITRMNILTGELRWSFSQPSPRILEIYISWFNNNKTLDKTYVFSING